MRDRGRKGFPPRAGIVILTEVLDSAVTSTLKQTPPQIHKHLMSISRVAAHLPRLTPGAYCHTSHKTLLAAL